MSKLLKNCKDEVADFLRNYKILAKELNVPAYRDIGLALRSKKNSSLAIKKFLDYLQYR